jgi:hypothetical protein
MPSYKIKEIWKFVNIQSGSICSNENSIYVTIVINALDKSSDICIQE